MLVPLTRATFEQLIPLIATGPQYAYYWGSVQKFLKNALISLVAVLVIWLLGKLLGEAAQSLTLIFTIIAGLYWFWAPVYWASVRNASYRRFPYSGFLRAKVVDVYITEELLREEESVDKMGKLVIIENRERRINVVIEDENGFQAAAQSPLRRIHKVINPGQTAECLVLSKQPDLGIIGQISDIYIPSNNLWVGDYPCLRRDTFLEVSRSLGGGKAPKPRSAAPRRTRYSNRRQF